jgi:glycosyltransferase involved in cell wall biosynthesis
MKIALVSMMMFSRSIGGVENHIRFMVRELQLRGHEIALFRPVWQDEYPGAITSIDNFTIQNINLGKRPFSLLKLHGAGFVGIFAAFIDKAMYCIAHKKVANRIKAFNPDLVWQHDFTSSWLACKALQKFFPVVLTNHTGEYLLLYKYFFTRPILKAMLKHYSAIIGPSRELTPQFHPQAYTIFNGVDLRLFKSLTNDERLNRRRQLLNANDQKIIFCPRRWAPTKGVLFFAKAITLLATEYKNLIFVFAGNDYADYPAYAKQIAAILDNCDAHIIMLGNLKPEDICKYYQIADITVIPSLLEAVSLSALEAMACGSLVLATKTGGNLDLIVDNLNGFLAAPGDEHDLAQKIKQIINLDSQHTNQIRQQASKQVNEEFSWSSIAAATEKVLLSTLSHKT